MADRFLKYLRFEKRYSPQTITSYQTDLRQFTDFLSNDYEEQPQNASHLMIRSWIMKLSDTGMDPSSINRKIACLRSYFKFLRKQELIVKDPMTRIRILKTRKKLPHFVNENEMNLLLDGSAVPDGHDELRDLLIVELLYGTGMRLSELIHLKESAVNLADRSIKVLGKRNKERVIPFASPLVSLITKYREVRNREVAVKDQNYFFVTNKGAKLYPVMVNRVVKKYLSLTSVDKKSPHVLRHSYATHLLNKGAEINAVKDLLGHTSLAATQVYTHNTMEKLKKIFDQAHPKA